MLIAIESAQRVSIGEKMSRKGAYIGGSSVVRLGSVGGPERSKQTENPALAAFPRSGGAEIRISKTRVPTKPRLHHATFKKFRRQANDVSSWLPYVGTAYRQAARALARIQKRVEEIASSEYTEEAASDASELRKRFYSLKSMLGDAEIARAKFAEREAHRASKKDDEI